MKELIKLVTSIQKLLWLILKRKNQLTKQWSKELTQASHPSAVSANNNLIISYHNQPQEYQRCVKILEETTVHDGGETLKSTLAAQGLELHLSVQDWIKIYSLHLTSPHNIDFAIDSQPPLQNDSNLIKEAAQFYATLISKIVKNIGVFSYNEKKVLMLTKVLMEHDIITIEGSKKGLPVAQLLRDIDGEIAGLALYPMTNRQELTILRELRQGITKLSEETRNLMIGQAARAMASRVKAGSAKANHQNINEVNGAPNNSQNNDNLAQKIKKIEEHIPQLDQDLKSICDKICENMKLVLERDYAALDEQNKVLFKKCIEQDIPEIIFNYMVLPSKLKSSLIDKESGKSVKEMTQDNLLLVNEFLADLEMNSPSHHTSLRAIKATNVYLKNRK